MYTYNFDILNDFLLNIDSYGHAFSNTFHHIFINSRERE